MAMDSKESLRAFLALPLAEAFQSSVRPVVEKLKTQYPEIKWVNPSQLHVTLHFFGQINSKDITVISRCVKPAVDASQPFEIYLKGMGCFPHIERPKVIWVGIEGAQENLMKLHSALEASLEKAGFSCEARSFKSHLTLGRVRQGRKISSLHLADFGPTEAKQITEIILYESILTSSGPLYEKIEAFKLSSP